VDRRLKSSPHLPLVNLTHLPLKDLFQSLKYILKMSFTDSTATDIARNASVASRQLAILSNDARNEALTALHQALDKNRASILAANAKDVELATRAAEDGTLSHSVLKRLDLSRPGKYDDMLEGILSVRDLEDPGMYYLSTFFSRIYQ